MKRSVLSGSYELLDLIAEGGMAEVWRARSRGAAGFEKTVVIKRVLPALMANPGFADLLVREAKIAARLSHSNIVQILDLGEEDGAYFIVMEHVHGQDLGRVIARAENRRGISSGVLPLPVRLWIVAVVAKALDYAHRRRDERGQPMHIVHRDVSPQNVLISYDGQVKVADFGIARADAEGLGRDEDPSVLRGKFAYMSPEQARMEPLDARSDVFSLGLVMYELITGDRAYTGRNSAEVLARARTGAIPPIDARALSVPEIVADLLDRSLAVERSARFANAAEMHAALSEILFSSGVPVGETDLAASMRALFDAPQHSAPNKLNVDLLMRAAEDARVVPLGEGSPSSPPSSQHGLHSTSLESRGERVPAVLLVAAERPSDEDAFRDVVPRMSGLVLSPFRRVREALFGHRPPAERGPIFAARAALELATRLRVDGPPRVEPVPPMAIARGTAMVFGSGDAEPSDALRERAVSLLRTARAGDIVVDAPLREALAKEHVLERAAEGMPTRLEAHLPGAERDRAERETPLVGRNTALERLTEAILRASSSRSEAVLVVGEAGSGKSRVLRELRRYSESANVRFVRSGGDREPSRHFGALASMFADLAGVEAEDTARERFRKVEWLRVLGLSAREVRVVGRLLGLDYPVGGDERMGRPVALDVLLALDHALRGLASDGTVVAILSDVQWSDDATRQLLPLLARGLAGSRVLLVVSARPGTPYPPFPARTIGLERLDPVSTGRLFAISAGLRGVDTGLRDRLLSETGGNPEWIEALGNELRGFAFDSGVAQLPARVSLPVPDTMQQRVDARMSELRADDRDVLRVAAAFPQGVDQSLLTAILGMPRAMIEASRKRLLKARLLESIAGPEPLFREPGAWGEPEDDAGDSATVFVRGSLVRRAIEASGDDETRARIHRRIATILESRGAAEDDRRIEQLAYHAARSGTHPLAAEYLVLAGEAACDRRELSLGAARFAEAVDLLVQRDAPNARAEAQRVGTRAIEVALEASELELATRVLDLLDDGYASEPIDSVGFVILRSRVLQRRREFTEAVALLESIQPQLDQVTDLRLRGRAYLELGRALFDAGRVDEGASVLSHAGRELERAGDEMLQGVALSMQAVALSRRGSLDQAKAAVERALELSTRPGAEDLLRAALYASAEVEEAVGRLSVAADRWQEAADAARGVEAIAYATLRTALISLELGDEPKAARLAESAAAQARAVRQSIDEYPGMPIVAHLAGATQAALAASSDADRTYLARAERAAHTLERLGDRGHAAIALWLCATVKLRLEDPQGAARDFAQAAVLARSAGWERHAVRYDSMAKMMASHEPGRA